MSDAVLSVSMLIGQKVKNIAGEELGKIDDLVLEESSGRILYAAISLGGVLRMRSRVVAIPWKRLRVRGDYKAVVLNTDKQTLKNAPTFDRKYWPDMSLPEWRDRIETYFAYSPAEEPEMAEGVEFLEPSTISISIEELREEEGLARRVECELEAAQAFDMHAIQITSREGNVILDGKVASRAEFILADNIAKTVRGVETVNNNLRVSKAA